MTKGLSSDRVVLAGFLENSNHDEWGVIINDKLEVFEYRRKSNLSTPAIRKWRKVSDISTLLDTFPAVEVALDIARESFQS